MYQLLPFFFATKKIFHFMKKLFPYIASIILLISTSACSDFLDVNDNPNRATTADPALLFTSAINNFSTNRTVDYGTPAASWSQLWSGGGSRGAGVFTRPERYIISVFTNGNTWRSHYREVHKDLNFAIEGAESANPVNNNAAAQSKIFRALTYYSSTVTWEDVPFDEAINFEQFPNPNFDTQERVFDGIIALIDEALAQIDLESPVRITSNDLIYGGDMDNWARLARSLRLRTLMTMVDARPAVATDIGQMINNGGMISSSTHDAEFPYFDAAGNKNPIFQTLESFAGGANLFFFASENTVNLMQSMNDPRIPYYFDEGPNAEAGFFEGVGPGENATGETSVISDIIIRPDAPDILFSFSEQMLLEAEAHIRGFAGGGAASADEKYRAGIRANMTYYGVPNDDIETYLATLPNLTEISTEDARKAIAEQQWLDLIQRPLEAWTTWRRNEIPALRLPTGAQTGNLIRRLQYPPDEVAANPNVPDQKPLDERMWFDR